MIKFLVLFCFVSVVFASGKLAFSNQKEHEDKVVYTIQLFSDKDIAVAQKILQSVPVEFRDETHLYRSDDYIKARYSQSDSYNTIKPYLEVFQKAGFKDAFMVKSTSLFMDEILIDEDSKKDVLKQNYKNNISQFDKSNILLKAQNAYKKGNESEAMIYYEMMISLGDANQKVKNNLCYLYGKNGAWSQAKDVIDSQVYQGGLIYAYAYGAVLNNQENFYEEILPYAIVDSSGRLMLLTGYYFEKKDDMQRAISFYKMAYEKNRTDLYNAFTYARVLDIEQKAQAVTLYKDILNKINSSHPLYDTIHKRVSELE